MTWLPPYHVVRNCNAMTLTIVMHETDKLESEGVYKAKLMKTILFVPIINLVGTSVQCF